MAAESKPLSPAELALSYLAPRLIAAERERECLLQDVIEEGRALARERGCSFIREERLRAEFGGGL